MNNQNMLSRAAALVFALCAVITAQAQTAPKAPAADPAPIATKDKARKVQAAIAPYTEKARKTYPGAKARYLAGLPKGETFFVTAKLSDLQGHSEGVFLRVTHIANGKITGLIASDVIGVAAYKAGDEYTLPEAELVDWMISKPDGSEEGNVVGKFLETYRP